MGIIGFIFWWLLPFIICMGLIPKYVAANSTYHVDYDNPILVRHVAVSLVPAIVPFLSWFAVVSIIFFYVCDYQKVFKHSWLDMQFSDLFKKKVIEK
jgi:hypothetical protein